MNLETEERGKVEDLLRRELEAQRQKLDRELVRRAHRIYELEQTIAQMERDFHSSLSWRITQPLRVLKAFLARLLGR
ncbi:MAG TPA: hypothetical protein VF009_00370 [Solirubrobacterales bacterium]